ncbi:hypothetical protein [Rickettsiales endosymbiont of Stachyamoeba lipophora]|uniref:hypothetical protein n=1 Tax=Rickettsiales endosymbiont of Stachyamoeba lipophora TaxID=2486578 RepID=UPI000F6E0AF6|nr:hypothetical protein [Rickettsiales endosymbiont of Stachyamoeba lipophora]AZL15014.1 hypothetical protein EF513_00315 [Rickettsiales endosymbiont of Stachyamoeba lipophora]
MFIFNDNFKIIIIYLLLVIIDRLYTLQNTNSHSKTKIAILDNKIILLMCIYASCLSNNNPYDITFLMLYMSGKYLSALISYIADNKKLLHKKIAIIKIIMNKIFYKATQSSTTYKLIILTIYFIILVFKLDYNKV